MRRDLTGRRRGKRHFLLIAKGAEMYYTVIKIINLTVSNNGINMY